VKRHWRHEAAMGRIFVFLLLAGIPAAQALKRTYFAPGRGRLHNTEEWMDIRSLHKEGH